MSRVQRAEKRKFINEVCFIPSAPSAMSTMPVLDHGSDSAPCFSGYSSDSFVATDGTYDSHENTILTREMSTMTDLSFSPNVDVSFSLTNLRNPETGTVDTTTENDISFTVSEGGKSSDMSEEERGNEYIPTSTNSSTESENGDDMNCQKTGMDNDMKYIVFFFMYSSSSQTLPHM